MAPVTEVFDDRVNDQFGPSPEPPQLEQRMTIPMKVALCCALAFGAYVLIASTYRDAEPTAADRFGCAKTYINARGEDTGECQ